MSKADETIKRICGQGYTPPQMSGHSQCSECDEVYTDCVWDAGATLVLESTEDVGGGAGEPAEHEDVCPGCGERETRAWLTMDVWHKMEDAREEAEAEREQQVAQDKREAHADAVYDERKERRAGI